MKRSAAGSSGFSHRGHFVHDRRHGRRCRKHGGSGASGENWANRCRAQNSNATTLAKAGAAIAVYRGFAPNRVRQQ